MRMRKIFSVAVGVLLVMAACVDNRNPDNDNPIPSRQLQSLDHAIAQSSHYAAAARRPIDSLVRVVSRTTDNARASLILSDIAHEMSVLNSDSAIIYADEAMRRAVLSANDSVEVAARLARCNALASAGIFNLAEKEFETLEHTPCRGVNGQSCGRSRDRCTLTRRCIARATLKSVSNSDKKVWRMMTPS